MPYVRVVRAYEGETVEIQWTTEDGVMYYERFTIPPKTVREARLDQERTEDARSRRKDLEGL